MDILSIGIWILLCLQYDLQADMTRRQVEYEVQRLQDMMHEIAGFSISQITNYSPHQQALLNCNRALPTAT